MAGAGALAFGAGLAAANALLHAAGVGMGLALARGAVARVIGSGTALAGAAPMIG
jgi:urease accessory protein